MQPRHRDFAGDGQPHHRRVGIVDLEIGLRRGEPEHGEIGERHQDEHHRRRDSGYRRLHETDAEIDHAGENHDRGNHDTHAQQCDLEAADHGLGQGLHVRLHRLEMHEVEKRDVGDHSRQEGVGDHLRIGDADIFHHQEGGGPHQPAA